MEHGDLVRDVLDELHVVLDHQHRAILDDRAEQFGGLEAFRDAHAGDRLVQHQQVGLLDQQHADLEPLLLAVAEKRAPFVQLVLEEDDLRDLRHPLAHRGVALEGERAPYGAAPGIGDLQILEDREVFVDRGRLELAADAREHDLALAHPGQFLVAEDDRACGGLGLPADEVEHSGLARAVGADDHADLVLVDVEGEVVDGFEAVERDREAFHREQEGRGLRADRGHRFILTRRPPRPVWRLRRRGPPDRRCGASGPCR